MRRAIAFAVTFFFLLQSAPARAAGNVPIPIPVSCSTILSTVSAQVRNDRLVDDYRTFRSPAGDIAEALVAKFPHLRPDSLRTILEMAFDNAVGHGGANGVANIGYGAYRTPDGEVVVWITNDLRVEAGRPVPLPRELTQIYTATSPPVEVPAVRRDRAGSLGDLMHPGEGGGGLPTMIRLLRKVTTEPGGSPSLRWLEVNEAGATPVARFELRLPAALP